MLSDIICPQIIICRCDNETSIKCSACSVNLVSNVYLVLAKISVKNSLQAVLIVTVSVGLLPSSTNSLCVGVMSSSTWLVSENC